MSKEHHDINQLFNSEIKVNGGSLDQRFGKYGFAEIGSAAQQTSGTSGVIKTPEGQLLVAWSLAQPADTQVGLARLTADGAPDRLFGHDGIASGVFKQGHRSGLLGLVARADASTLVYGNYLTPTDSGYQSVPSLLCFTPQGEIDTEFAQAGVFSLPELPLNEEYNVSCCACALPDNATLLMYSKNRNGVSTTFIIKLTPDGEIDPRFADQGVCEFQRKGLSTVAGGVIALKNGHFAVFSGFLSDVAFVACFDSQGAPVPQFGENGVTELAYADKTYLQLNLVETQNGLISLGSATLGDNLFRGLITGLTLTGQVDPQFNGGEPVIVTHPTALDGSALCHQIAVQADNKLVISGYRPLSSSTPAGFIGRYLPDGRADLIFGREGLADTGAFVLSTSQQGIVEAVADKRLIFSGVNSQQGSLAGYHA